MQQKETDGTMKASPNGKETKNKDKLKMPKGVASVTSEVIVAALKPNIKGEKTNMVHW